MQRSTQTQSRPRGAWKSTGTGGAASFLSLTPVAAVLQGDYG
jgi:hypothetical protein